MSGALWSFIGACLTFIVSIGAAGWVLWATPGLKKLDRALHFGLAGLIGLGALGILTFFIGLIPGALIALRYPVELIVGLGGIIAVTRPKARPKVDVPHGREWVPALIVGFAALLALMSVLAPPDTIEWDSLAYHLAVPKLWLQQGHISYIPFIHHSNFPFVFDNLYLWGLQWGGEAGAKAFVYAAAVYGGIAIFGLTRHVYSREAAWWATVAYATIPVILWLSGTAYIDVPNGLCAGLGIAMAALWVRDQDKSYLWLAAILLGLAAASKYTALQTIGAVGLVLLIIGIRRKQPARYFKSAVFVGVLAMAIASPWYIKNVLWTGNPVYPFFYGLLGGKNWSAERSKVYTHEQLTFGVGSDAETGKHDVSQFGHAVLGLGYQPGRYINPLQTSGG
ncbi:MAG: hypothetical protein QOJ65_2405, partial [Fimbriimonadaceae bacterium]|nr:hypothetical protein [Fimbriimonadaceae bacterium]